MLRRPTLIELNFFWLATTALLVAGVSLPMFTFTHFYFFDDTFSLTSGIFHLLGQGEVLLFLLLFSFSLLVPSVKMLMLLYTINAAALFSNVAQRYLDRIALIGKWSMLDVFVIAIMAVTIKLGMVAQVTIHHGLVMFALGVILSMILPLLISRVLPSHNTSDERHIQLVLPPQQLSKLLSERSVSVSNKIAGPCKPSLVDVYDQHQQWQAKAELSVSDNTQAQLRLLAKRANQHQVADRDAPV